MATNLNSLLGGGGGGGVFKPTGQIQNGLINTGASGTLLSITPASGKVVSLFTLGSDNGTQSYCVMTLDGSNVSTSSTQIGVGAGINPLYNFYTINTYSNITMNILPFPMIIENSFQLTMNVNTTNRRIYYAYIEGELV